MAVRTQIFFDTDDAFHIVGDFVLPDDTIRGGVVFLHMMPSNRHSFETLQHVVAECGIASLAIDLRGHGESVSQEGKTAPHSYKNFTDADHQASALDVRGAVEYLQEMIHLDASHIALVGASIGANLAIQYAGEHTEIPLVIALSPGLDYRGIQTAPAVKKMKADQSMIIAASREDEYSFETLEQLLKLKSGKKEGFKREGSEHGTDMFIDESFLLKIVQSLCKMNT